MLRAAVHQLARRLPSAPPHPLRAAAVPTAAAAPISFRSLVWQDGDAPIPESFANDEERRKVLGRMIYRSKQRGWLELDLLMGMWAEKNLHSLEQPVLLDYSSLLDEENPDLFKWLTGQEVPPERVSGNTAYSLVKAHVDAYLRDHAAAATVAPAGVEWKRGWSDAGEELTGGEASSEKSV